MSPSFVLKLGSAWSWYTWLDPSTNYKVEIVKFANQEESWELEKNDSLRKHPSKLQSSYHVVYLSTGIWTSQFGLTTWSLDSIQELQMNPQISFHYLTVVLKLPIPWWSRETKLLHLGWFWFAVGHYSVLFLKTSKMQMVHNHSEALRPYMDWVINP